MTAKPMSIHKRVTRDDLEILVCHVVMSDDVLRAAVPTIKLEDFDESELVYKLVYASASQFFKDHMQRPPEVYLRADIDKRIKGDSELNHPHFIEAVRKLIDTALSFKDLMPEYAMDVLSSFIFQRQIGNEVLDMAQKGYVSVQAWEQLLHKSRNYCVERTGEIAPFALSTDPLVGVKPRDPTGVSFLDEMLGGGVRAGEAYGFLAPSGGGKTTLSNQMAIEYAKKKKNVLVFSYEQPVDAEYLIPVYACATKIPRKKWENISTPAEIVNRLSAEEQEDFRLSREAIDKYLHYVDYSNLGSGHAGCHGVMEIDTKIEQFEQRNGKVDAVFIDWFWPLVTRSYQTLQLGWGKSIDQRLYAQSVIDEIHVMCSKRKIWAWVSHQLNPDKAKQKRDMEFEDAAELKSFAWYLNGCFCLTKLDDIDGMGTIKFSKARSAKQTSKVIKLHGEVATFMKADGDYVYDDKQGKHVEVTELNAIPKERMKTKEQLEHEGGPAFQ